MNMSAPRMSSHARTGGDFRTRNGGNWTGGNRTGDRQRWSGNGDRQRWNGSGDRHRWTGGNHHHRWHRGHYYRPRYYSYYPFGFGYGYGFGSPFWNSSLYYSDYAPRYYSGSQGSGGSIVAQVQQELANSGFYRGPIDGVIGNGTRAAIRAYERANGLRVDGRIDDQLLGSMGLS